MTSTTPTVVPVGLEDRPSFRADVEGLRAVAVILVVAFHARFSTWSGGFIGVDVFFVLSGYLITGLLVHEVERTGRVNLLRFYARRARRLLPAAALVVLATVAAESFLLSPLERTRYVRAAMAATVYLSNVYFHRQSLSYFSPDLAGNPFLHTWSLAVEEQFYLIWPILIAGSFAFTRSRRSLTAAMSVLSVASVALCVWLARVDQPAAFYEAPARAWEFGIGGLASLLPATNALRAGAWRWVAGWGGLIAIAAAGALITASTPFPGVATLLPVLGTVSILIAGAGGAPRGNSTLAVGRVLGSSPLQLIGRLSYSWYLWHWPVLVIGMAIMPAIALPGRIMLIGLSLVLAASSHVALENPIRYSRALARRPGLSLGLAAVLTVCGFYGIRREEQSAKAEAATPAQQRIIAAAKNYPRSLYGRKCLLDFGDVREPDCAFGNVASPAVLVLFGDSHMAQWFSAYEAVARSRDWRLEVLTKSGCPPALAVVGLWTMHRPYPECTLWRDAALKRILALHPVAVVLAASDAHVTSPARGGAPRLSLQEWQDGMRRTLTRFDSAGIRTLVLRDAPGSPFEVPTCLSRALSHRRPFDGCNLPRKAGLREDVFRVTRTAAAGLTHVTLLDLSDHFCDATTCPAIRDGIIVYRDPGHMADAYARTLAPYVFPIVVP
ncbi:acyltransferase family protein [soil metagenome]